MSAPVPYSRDGAAIVAAIDRLTAQQRASNLLALAAARNSGLTGDLIAQAERLITGADPTNAEGSWSGGHEELETYLTEHGWILAATGNNNGYARYEHPDAHRSIVVPRQRSAPDYGELLNEARLAVNRARADAPHT